MNTTLARSLAAMASLAASRFLPASALTRAMFYVAVGITSVEVFVQLAAGYRHRRHHWTGASWWRFLRACALAGVVVAVGVGMTLIVDAGLPIAGAPHSPTRLVWAVLSLGLGIGGLIRLLTLIHRLASGDPAKPFIVG